jgi:hypothetical protein
VDRFVEALKAISAGEYAGEYVQDVATGEFHPVGWEPDYKAYFSLD